MTPTQRGSVRLFQFAGIEVFVHWSWFLVAIFELKGRAGSYRSFKWNVLEYLALFAVVLLHEFGHALACRQTGGKAQQIVLWPLGGVAYVTPPPRPGATLWSLAAGPLVNLVLLLLTVGFYTLGRKMGLPASADRLHFLRDLALMNFGLLTFNLLPIYPLDGGQMLRAVLWFFMGRATSLTVSSVVGLLGVLALFGVAVAYALPWLAIMAVFVLISCWRGMGRARALARLARLPRHNEFQCPACHAAPPAANLWGCGQCRFIFDTFASRGTCPNCGGAFEVTACPECGEAHPMPEWHVAPPVDAA